MVSALSTFFVGLSGAVPWPASPERRPAAVHGNLGGTFSTMTRRELFSAKSPKSRMADRERISSQQCLSCGILSLYREAMAANLSR